MNDHVWRSGKGARRAPSSRITWPGEIIAIALLFAPACGESSDNGKDAGAPVPDPPQADASACNVRIAPSDDDQRSVQTALIDTPAGSTICFDSGTFRFTDELTLTSRGMTLRGSPTTVWEFRD